MPSFDPSFMCVPVAAEFLFLVMFDCACTAHARSRCEVRSSSPLTKSVHVACLCMTKQCACGVSIVGLYRPVRLPGVRVVKVIRTAK